MIDATAFAMPVERGKIREFAKAIGSDAAEYEQGSCSPPTFLVTSTFWNDVSPIQISGFDRRRLLHGEQEYVFHGPPPAAGEQLHATISLGDTFERDGKRGGKMRFAVIVTEFRDNTGLLRAEQRMTIIETEPKEASA
ncbi:MAG: MaoC family dehydratase N-terminal domain-containing protein [Nocardioides sp.]|nr:MaoC family dehydratase N-terminal domain-containing protein [Nocardioides sp.]